MPPLHNGFPSQRIPLSSFLSLYNSDDKGVTSSCSLRGRYKIITRFSRAAVVVVIADVQLLESTAEVTLIYSWPAPLLFCSSGPLQTTGRRKTRIRPEVEARIGILSSLLWTFCGSYSLLTFRREFYSTPPPCPSLC